MSYTPDQLLKIADNYEQLTAKSLVVSAAKKDKKKLDPKAKVRNRGTVCVPAESAKDKKDHFPINDEGQARNALARVHQYSSAPAWYSGSLKGLQDLVSRKVHSKYPGIGKEKKSKKSSYYDSFLEKYGQAQFNPQQVDTPEAGFNAAPSNPYMDKGEDPEALAQRQDKAMIEKMQQFLKGKGYNLGNFGPNKDGIDGRLGTKTLAAIKAYQTSKGSKLTDPNDPNTQAEVLKDLQGAMGGYLTTVPGRKTNFDHKAANDAMNAVSTFLTQLQAWQGQKQITPNNVEQIKAMLAQHANSVGPTMKSINDTMTSTTETPEAKQLAAQLAQKSAKLNNDIAAWNKFLETIPKPMTNDKPYG